MPVGSTRILIADDEEDILDLLEYNLQQDGYDILKARDGEEAISLAQSHRPELIIMDIMMPRLDGVAACRAIRLLPGFDEVIIVFLTARSEEYSEVAAFEAGADDYIHKPIKPRVLKSRIKAILRRHRKTEDADNQVIRVHDLEILRDEYVVKKGHRFISLPRKEFELFFFLASRPGKVFKREELLMGIWDNLHVTDRTVDVHIRKLREKVGKKYIQTVKGVGYKFIPES